MINRRFARKYCCEDISLIENYDKAKRDLLETWDLHHRKEDEGYSRKELIDSGLYYKRPARELIFLTKKEHSYLHSKNMSAEHRRKISEAHKGVPKSDETKRKMSEARKGVPKSDETKRKMSVPKSDETKRRMSEAKKGKMGENHNRSKPVMQLDKKTGKIIKIWPCAREVERRLGIKASHISQCCLGQYKSAGGYKWRYA